MGIFRTRPNIGIGDSFTDAAPGRHNSYGDTYSVGVGIGRQNAADEGSYFVGTNAVVGTALAGHAAPAIADNDDTPLKTLLHIYNGGSRFVSIDYVKLALEVVNASSTSTNFVTFVDNDGKSTRTGGGTAITPVNTRSDNPASSGVTVYFGAVTVVAASARKTGQWTLRPVIAVAEDQYTFAFGAAPQLPNTLTILSTAASNLIVQCAPIVIAPGGNFHLCESNPSGASTAATYEFEFGFIER